MCELTEVTYMPGDVVWVKLGSSWWPGEVKDDESLPEEIMANLRKKPIAVVKFFGEDSYEYVKNLDNIYHYNNNRKLEFIKKGMDLTRAKSKQGSSVMDKFPTDVVTAESLTGGDVNILSTEAFIPKERPQYKDLFGTPSKKKTPKKNGVGRPSNEGKFSADRRNSQSSLLGKVNSLIQIKKRITHPRFIKESDHEVRIRQQPISPAKEPEIATVTHAYQCQQCSFGTSRQNVFILHCKAHRENVIKPETPSSSKSSANKAKRTPKVATATKSLSNKTSETAKKTPQLPKTPKSPKETAARRKIFQPAKKNSKKGVNTPVIPVIPKSEETKERDLEKRNSILADWDDEDMEEEEKEVKKIKLELDIKKEKEPIVVEKPAKSEKPVGKILNKKRPSSEKTMTKADTPATPASDPSSVYDLIEDAEEFVPPPRMSETKRLISESPAIPTESADTRELDKEVMNLLEETAVPVLPQVPSFSLKSKDIPSNEDVLMHEDENEQHLDEVNGILKSNNIPVVETVPSEVFTVPAPTLSTVTSPSANKTNGTLTTDTTLIQSQQGTNEVVVDPNTETATYVLVAYDESGGFQQFDGMSNTLLAYDSSQGEEGGTRTLYIDSSQLGASAAGLENLFLAIDAADGSGTSMVQIQPQQVTMQIGGTEQSTVTSEELSKSKQDILAVALANTQVLQPTPMEMHTQEAVVKVTNAAQSPVMTPRVTESHKIIPQNIIETSGIITDNITAGIR